MKIQKDSAVTLRCKVYHAVTGQAVDDSPQPMAYLHGSHGGLPPKAEAALEGQEAGFKATVDLSVEEAFGARDESLAISIPKTQFPPGVKVGGHLRTRTEDGREAVYRVVKIKGPQVLLDGNHAWAGLPLRFKLEVLEVRPATAEEIAHGHVHGAHGHQH